MSDSEFGPDQPVKIDAVFTIPIDVKLENTQSGSEEYYKCYFCDDEFHSSDEVARHIKTHTDNGRSDYEFDKGKKQKRGKLYLCREDEENIAAWYQEHDIFYRKDHRDYSIGKRKKGSYVKATTSTRKGVKRSKTAASQETIADHHSSPSSGQSDSSSESSRSPSPRPTQPRVLGSAGTPIKTKEGAGPSDADAGPTKKRKEKLVLTPADEAAVAAWFQEHEIFYNKYRRDYKNLAKRDRMLAEKAATLSVPCTGKQLKTWLFSMRTAFGKLKKAGPSGTEKVNPTDKERWILTNFSCCEPFIKRTISRQATKNKKVGETKAPLAPPPPLPVDDEEEVLPEISSVSQSRSTTEGPVKSATVSVAPIAPDQASSSFFQAMTSFMEDMRSKIPASNTAPATPQMRVARSFGEYVIQEAALLGPQEFLAFQRVVLDELLRQKEKTQARELQQQKL